MAVRWSGVPDKSVFANAIRPKGAARKMARGAGLPVTAEEKSGLRADVCMSPAIQDDASDVASRHRTQKAENISVNCVRICRS